jgi:alpha-glucosidase
MKIIDFCFINIYKYYFATIMKTIKKCIVFISILFISTHVFCQYRLNFDGYGDYVALNAPDIAGSWTFEAKVHRNGITPYSHLMTSADGQGGFRLEQYINSNEVGVTESGVADNSFTYQSPVGAWINLAIVCNGTNMQLFIDGVYKSTINSTIALPMGSISGEFFGAGCLFAQINEVRMWGVALNSSDIAAYMNSSIDVTNPNYANLLHYYNFSEGTGSILHDSKGTLDGTIHGASWVPIFPNDLEVSALLTPAATITSFSANNPIVVRLSNIGSSTITTDFSVSYQLDGGSTVSSVVNASSSPIAPFGYIDITFPSVNLTNSDIHSFKIYHSLSVDDYHVNDTLEVTSSKAAIYLGDVTDFVPGNGEYTFSSNVTKVKVSYYRDDVFRIQLAPNGIFKNNTDTLLDIQDKTVYSGVTWTDEGLYYKLSTNSANLRVYKAPLLFALYKSDNSTVIWEEETSIVFGSNTVQTLTTDPSEYFYGCGMQNGYFSHKNRSIHIENDYSNDWGVGSVSNPAPFFMSTKGYGVFRNTFKPGQYDFFNTMKLTHSDTYFDSYYFTGGSLKNVLEGYTYVTGRPFMIPRWGLEFGDADCYNKDGETTMDVVNTVAQVYRTNDMPGGWVLPNDGYGCGYTDLVNVNNSLNPLGFKMGLWSENSITTSAFEVGSAGVSVYKLDVALVGPGYKSSFDAGLKAYNGIETNGNRRGFVWTVAGWAGTQRFGTIWSGDQTGSWDNIKMHIPTVLGAGLSSFNCATGDVDGIYGGSAAQYVRDLQWKCFTPALMAISGWAGHNKQPYIYGGSYNTYNRQALKLKMRLTPYFYSYSRQANLTGVPTVRAMVLEFPQDTVTYSTTTQYQFMSGEAFLVAPVYTSSTVKNGIYLPESEWVDYSDGTVYNGPMTLNNYSAPLGKLPLFVKSGSIIPMYPEMLYNNELPFDTLTLDLYPGGSTTFTLYEDEGSNLNFKANQFSETVITLNGNTTSFIDPVVVNVGATVGTYEGQLPSRINKLDFHCPNKPSKAILNTTDTLVEYLTVADFNLATSGWYYAEFEKKGIVHVKTNNINVNSPFEVKLIDFQLGVKELSSKNDLFKIYPNPSKGNISLSAFKGVVIAEVKVFDILGNELKTISNSDNKDIVSFKINEKAGFYFVSVKTNKGTVVRKIEIME